LGLDAGQYVFIPTERRPREPIISVIGSMNWYPSHSAAVRLLTRLLPAIRRNVPNTRVFIVGWHAQQALRQYLPQPGVNVFENVPDTRPFFERSSILLYAPLRGSGMKVKVLEAFAYGVPVVTTSEGVEGIPARDGIHAGISDDDAGLVDRAVNLLTNPSLQEPQRQAARALVEQHCHPRVVLDALEECYADILTRQRRQAA
jgi:glycosyltransferase involved in cell wall biosynthesis